MAKQELHASLDDVSLAGIPILVCGNKIDVSDHLNEKEIIEGLNLDYIFTNDWAVVMTSAKNGTNVKDVLNWLIESSNNKE